MTENTPNKDPDELEETVNDGIEEDKESTQEPDLLFANIDALMEGSETPVSEPVNLDDYPLEAKDKYLEETTASIEEPVESLDEGFIPSNDADEFSLQDEEIIESAFRDDDPEDPESNSLFDDTIEQTTETIPQLTEIGDQIAERNETIVELGFYGKLPTYGDFIQKRLPQNFINPWHEWVQTGMLALREHDPDGWLSYYLNCPAWCFVLGAGICGDQAVAGITIPSVDRAGRYFNFTMASILPTNTDPAVFAGARAQWFERLENLALSVLESEMDQDRIDASINEQSAELKWDERTRPAFEADENHNRISGHEYVGIAGFLPALLHQLISRQHDQYGLWWHRGSPQVAPQFLSCIEMPVGGTFLGLIMDRELQDTANSSSKITEPDYIDELLSD